MPIHFYYHYLCVSSKTVLMVIKQLNLDNVNYIIVENFIDKKNPNEQLLKVRNY